MIKIHNFARGARGVRVFWQCEEMGLPYYYYENTEGGHAAGANLKQQARTQALQMVYLTRKLMDEVEPKR